MPELPDLEIVREVLAARVVGLPIVAARVRRPIVVRSLLAIPLEEYLPGKHFSSVTRRGKFLLLWLEGGATLVVNPMLAGRFRVGDPLSRDRSRDVLVLRFVDGHELRYHDAKDMGKIYLATDLSQIPGWADLGPEATDLALDLNTFRERLRKHNGEIKGVLANQAFVAGIGNAYADEICWAAGVYPFRRRATLSADEVARLHAATQAVLAEAVATLRHRVGAAIDVEVRDFLQVHGRAGQPCPRCGTTISEVTRERRVTHFCRNCQPGLMVQRRTMRKQPE